MKILFFFIFSFYLFSQNNNQYIDGVAAIIEERVILKSDLLQMVNMAAVQNNINPELNPGGFLKLQESVLQSMVDQKILLEMAELDSVFVDEKDVDKNLDQQIEMLISQAGGEKKAVEVLGQSLSDFRREFWFDMRDRLITEKYQQQMINNVKITRSDVVSFYSVFKDSLPPIPTKVKTRHLLIPILPSEEAKNQSLLFLKNIKKEIINGSSFEELAKEHSEDPGSKNNGGSIGWVTRGSLVKGFETAAFTAKINKIVGPVETEFGYHLIETLEKKGEKIKVRHILSIPKKNIEDNKRAFNFAKSLKKDSIKTLSDFKLMVKRHTHDEKTKKVGGDLGWIDPNNYTIPEIGQSLSFVGIDTCSVPINSSYGFHLLWFEGIKEGGKPNLLNHWSDIELMALNKKQMDWYGEWIENIRERFFIKIING